MYSYVIEFNLDRRGEDAQEYLAEAARHWPRLWGEIPGVTGTLLLSSAFALGGDFEYQLRVDIENLATLSQIEAVMKSGKGGWHETRREWFKARTAARARVSGHVAGNEKYCQQPSGTDGAIHLVYRSQPGESGRSVERVEALTSVAGVVSAQVVRSVLGSADAEEHTWVRLDSLDGLDAVAAADLGAGHSQLFGEIRELDGSLFAGA